MRYVVFWMGSLSHTPVNNQRSGVSLCFELIPVTGSFAPLLGRFERTSSYVSVVSEDALYHVSAPSGIWCCPIPLGDLLYRPILLTAALFRNIRRDNLTTYERTRRGMLGDSRLANRLAAGASATAG